MKRLLFSFAICLSLFAQNPDVQSVQTFTTATTGAPVWNSPTIGAATWQLTFNTTGFTAVTLQVETSEDCSGSPCGVWTAIPSVNVVQGSNPITWTSTSSPPVNTTVVFQFAHPWYRVNVTSVTGTGTLTTLLLGYKGTSPGPLPGALIVQASPVGNTCTAGSPILGYGGNVYTCVGGVYVVYGGGSSGGIIPPYATLAALQAAHPTCDISLAQVLAAPPGQQLYSCSGSGVWTQLIGGEISNGTYSLNCIAGTGGTVANGLAKWAANGTCISVTGTEGILGIAETAQLATASVIVDIIGPSTCLSEGSITAGDFLIAGVTTPTSCKDSGQSSMANIPSTTRVLGKATASVLTGNLVGVNLIAPFTPGDQSLALTGDVTAAAGSGATTVVKLNGTSLAGLGSGILQNTTGTGVPSIVSNYSAISGLAGYPSTFPPITTNLALLNASNTWTGVTQIAPIWESQGTAATDSATLGSELTTSGTCTGTGWAGLLTATYTSGISATGTGTCNLAFTGGGCVGATGTIAVTSNVPGAITVVTPGYGCTSTPTTATVSNGTLTCSGTPVLTSTVGSTYPNYYAPGNTNALTCTGFSSGSFYQTVTGITNNSGVATATYTSGVTATGTGTCNLAFTGGTGQGGSATIAVTSNVPGAITIVNHGNYTVAPTGATVTNGSLTCTGPAVLTSTLGGGTVTVAIGTAQTAATSSAASSTLTFGPKANGTSLTYTPTAAFVGTLSISAKAITPISVTRILTTDSTAAQSVGMSSLLASLYDISVGVSGMPNVTTGLYNTNVGIQGMGSLTTGSNNTNTGDVGMYALTTGSNNTNIGYEGMYALTTGTSNTNTGVNGMLALTTGIANTNTGVAGMDALTTGSDNTNIGYTGMYSLTAGNGNTNDGYTGMYSLTTGSYNTASGYNAGRYVSGGSNPNQTSSYSTYLGQATMALANGDTDETVIGSNATGAGSHTVVLGSSTVTDVYAGSAAPTATQHALGFESDGTTFTIASGCGTPGSLTGGGTAGSFTAGQAACAPVITFTHSAPHGWSCFAADISVPTDIITQSAYTQTSCTLTGTVVSGNTIVFHAMAF